MESITKHLSALARDRKWKYIEVRGGDERSPGRSSVPTFYGHALALRENAQEVFAGFTSAVRRNLSKAERSGITVEITRTREALSQFYDLHMRTRGRHGAPPQPFRFFESIYRNLVNAGHGFLAVAGKTSKPIAAGMFLTCGENAVYKFGASDERFQEHRANNLVMWEAIKYLCRACSKSLHFGRTSPDNDGLRRFKMGWGAREEAIEYSKLDPGTNNWMETAPDSRSITRHIFRRLPSRMNRWAVSLLYPHLD